MVLVKSAFSPRVDAAAVESVGPASADEAATGCVPALLWLLGSPSVLVLMAGTACTEAAM